MASAAPGANPVDRMFTDQVQPLLTKFCIDCHGPEKQKSRIRFDQIDTYRAEHGALWTKVHEALTAGEMPPEDKPQPNAVEKKRLADWILARQRTDRAGTLRRLNRREISAALQDLTGLNVDYAAMLPADGKVDGFDTGAEALQDAADSVERLMIVTRRAVDAIRFLEPADGKILTADLRHADPKQDPKRILDAWHKEHGHRFRLKGYGVKQMGALLSPVWLGDRDKSTIAIPAERKVRGVARLQVTVSAHQPVKGLPATSLRLRAGGVQDIAFDEITGSFEKPQTFTYFIQLDELPKEKDEVKISLSNLVEFPYAVEGFANDDKLKPDETIPGGPTLYRPKYDRKKIKDPLKFPVPYIVLQRIEFEPNHVAAWPPASWGAKPGRLGDTAASARKLLALWMQRAWRRPVTPAEQEPFLALYRKLRGQKMSFDDALRAAFQSVLMSGPFRYLASPSDPDEAIAQHAIASRLSFMLSGAPPDDTLRDLAAAGKLRDPKTIDAQIDRLLDSESSAAFTTPFVTQWLEIGQPITIAMRSIKQQDFRFGRHLRASMRAESTEYVRRMLLDNRPARELIHSDWTMMNNILARHYGYDGIAGMPLRKVDLRQDDPRGGGLLGQAGIQSMLCWMGENWVIYRGAWTLRHILDDPPPPPPLEVPELIPSEGKNRGKSFRQLLDQHQEDPNCSVCHTKMDPIGFAFENFDLSGRWRDKQHETYVRNELDGKVEWYGKGKTRPLDTTGQLPRGETFKSFAEFKQQVVAHYQDDLVRGLLKNLVLYGTGRKAHIDDLNTIKAIMAQQKKDGYRMRDLLKALLRSEIFLESPEAPKQARARLEPTGL